MTGKGRKPAAEGLYWLLFQASDAEAEEVAGDLLLRPNVTWAEYVQQNLRRHIKTRPN
jgi:hypothetical protein